MISGRSIIVSALLAVSVMALNLAAQEDMPPPGAGRGGRGGRGGGGRGNTREFLGLGPAPDEAAAKKGEPLYKQNCGTCHGDNARGSQGPNLVRSVVVLHDEKGEEIGPVIKNGRPQARHAGLPGLSQDDLYNISQYLHLQVELAANRGTYGATYGALRNGVSGDATKGAEFFNGSGGCTKCHSVTGDLAKIGAKFPQASTLQSRFLWPHTPGPAKVTVTLASGESIDRDGPDHERLRCFHHRRRRASYHQWPRDQVKVEVEDRLGGHRALLPKYTDADIHNLTAYLVTLK